MYTIEYYLAIKNESIWVGSNELEEPTTYYMEWSKSEKQISYISHIYGI